MAQLSRRFQLVSLEHWPSPRSLATTSGVSVDVLSSGYLDVSVPRVRFLSPMYSRIKYPHVITVNSNPDSVNCSTLPGSNLQLSKVGFPIRKSTDQRLFAPPRSLSQRTTSFIASYRQGIHQMPLSHLIALISDAHFGCQRSGVRCHVGTRSDHLVPDQKSIETNRYETAVKLFRCITAQLTPVSHAPCGTFCQPLLAG